MADERITAVQVAEALASIVNLATDAGESVAVVDEDPAGDDTGVYLDEALDPEGSPYFFVRASNGQKFLVAVIQE